MYSVVEMVCQPSINNYVTWLLNHRRCHVAKIRYLLPRNHTACLSRVGLVTIEALHVSSKRVLWSRFYI